MADDDFNLNEFSEGEMFLRTLPQPIWNAAIQGACDPERADSEYLDVEVVLTVRVRNRRYKHGKSAHRSWSAEEARISAAGGKPYVKRDTSGLMSSAWHKAPEGGA